MSKKHTDYKGIFHGADHEQYFPGCGVALTKFTDVATGIGDCDASAFEDALEQLALNGWDADALEQDIVARSFDGERLKNKPEALDEGWYYYVSILVAS